MILFLFRLVFPTENKCNCPKFAYYPQVCELDLGAGYECKFESSMTRSVYVISSSTEKIKVSHHDIATNTILASIDAGNAAFFSVANSSKIVLKAEIAGKVYITYIGLGKLGCYDGIAVNNHITGEYNLIHDIAIAQRRCLLLSANGKQEIQMKYEPIESTDALGYICGNKAFVPIEMSDVANGSYECDTNYPMLVTLNTSTIHDNDKPRKLSFSLDIVSAITNIDLFLEDYMTPRLQKADFAINSTASTVVAIFGGALTFLILFILLIICVFRFQKKKSKNIQNASNNNEKADDFEYGPIDQQGMFISDYYQPNPLSNKS